MLSPTGAPIWFGVGYVKTSDGTPATGLSVTYTIFLHHLDGSVTTVTTGTLTEIGRGAYGSWLAGGSTGVAGAYVCVAECSDTSVKPVQFAAELVGVALPQTVATNLNATVSSRFAASSFIAPDNTGIAVAASYSQSISQMLGTAGDGLTNLPDANVGVMRTAALAQFATTDTGQTTAATGSVAKLSQGGGTTSDPTAVPCTILLTQDGTTGGVPVADAEVWVTSTASPSTIIQGPTDSNSDGKSTFLLRAGNSYHLWAAKDGWGGIQGTLFTAVADP